MAKNKLCCFTFFDKEHATDGQLMINSFKHFHPDVKLIVYDQEYLDKIKYKDIPNFWYKSTSFFAKELIKEYETVVQINADSVITAPLDDIFDNTAYDIACVMNNNRTDPPVTVFNVPAPMYVNNGLIAMRSQRFINHWWDLCNRYYFDQFPFREQDILNIMIHYGDYSVLNLDMRDKWYGVISRGEWMRFVIKSGKLYCPAIEGYNSTQKQICVIHCAGGNIKKWNWASQFTPQVQAYLTNLTK